MNIASFMFNLIISIVNFKKQFEKYPKIVDIRRGFAEKKVKFLKKNMLSDLYGADAKFEFTMVRIADKTHLICYKSVQKDKILPAIYVLYFRVNVNQ